MEHLLVHLSYEARVGGPVQYRWMYPFERFLCNLKKRVKNKAVLEASICEAYIVEEISIFTTHYFEPDIICKKSKHGRNDDGINNENIEHMSIFNHLGHPYGASKMRAFLQDLYERCDVDTVDINSIVAMQFLPGFKTCVSCLYRSYKTNYQKFAANDINDEEEDSFEDYETNDDDDDEALGQDEEDEDDDDY
ncbi:UNVERIFIED_CONTAM: hypothetical protein Slati_0006000 [Sesamum latifolium]|uniref:DUF4218 domain-containing protein n=1 Tax=Sesamum latifolium TaxID=2727402 RepID=A0AAW2Y5Y6_9LAMI